VDDECAGARELPPDSPLVEKLQAEAPGSCLAVRLAKTHERDSDSEPLLVCDLCASLGGRSTCVPSLVGGEVIGSVLVQHAAPLAPRDQRRVAESVIQAAPVLGNLRNLALAQARALTDALKQINNVCGHEKGDEVLAAVAAVVSRTIRASDFAGRYGGEEFILLLPDTDGAGALVAAEHVRQAIADIVVGGLPHTITASFGVAALREDATEPALLLRATDRALYLAKAGGRNRVEYIPG
jgi:diguanylate cyclase (GGDEF)-like protein